MGKAISSLREGEFCFDIKAPSMWEERVSTPHFRGARHTRYVGGGRGVSVWEEA